ncbi:unnamed protein product [Nesidiocoris tenuis]|uniref:Uncharacterized protein n=1 Tax=Nesidiocoris tenuis TaxID=355587 RepID=A0A6H5H383_9HEMI|nr:unnamed protein product [Nesidiocoris tenuis]
MCKVLHLLSHYHQSHQNPGRETKIGKRFDSRTGIYKNQCCANNTVDSMHWQHHSYQLLMSSAAFFAARASCLLNLPSSKALCSSCCRCETTPDDSFLPRLPCNLDVRNAQVRGCPFLSPRVFSTAHIQGHIRIAIRLCHRSNVMQCYSVGT